MIEDELQRKLERFEASVENRTADGALIEELVEQCAGDVPDWEVSDCWPIRDYPRLSEFGLEPYDDGIDLVAEKTDGRRVAIQCNCLRLCKSSVVKPLWLASVDGSTFCPTSRSPRAFLGKCARALPSVSCGAFSVPLSLLACGSEYTDGCPPPPAHGTVCSPVRGTRSASASRKGYRIATSVEGRRGSVNMLIVAVIWSRFPIAQQVIHPLVLRERTAGGPTVKLRGRAAVAVRIRLSRR